MRGNLILLFLLLLTITPYAQLSKIDYRLVSKTTDEFVKFQLDINDITREAMNEGRGIDAMSALKFQTSLESAINKLSLIMKLNYLTERMESETDKILLKDQLSEAIKEFSIYSELSANDIISRKESVSDISMKMRMDNFIDALQKVEFNMRKYVK